MRRWSRDFAGARPIAQPLLAVGSRRRPDELWLTGIFRLFLRRCISLGNKTVNSWFDDRAPTMGAAIAFYTMFSLAPMLVIVVAVAGFVFGREAAEGALFGDLAKLVAPESAGAVQAMLRSASSTESGIIASAVGIGTLIVTATDAFSELQAALNLIWKVQASGNLGVWWYLKSRFLGLSVIISGYIDRAMPSFAIILYLVHPTLSFFFTTLFFAIIFKIL